MPKYESYDELSKKATKKWAEYTDPAKYEEGLSRIAPPGRRPKRGRIEAYGAHTTEKEAKKWLENWTDAMFE